MNAPDLLATAPARHSRPAFQTTEAALSPDQVAAYRRDGLLFPLPVYDRSAIAANRAGFERLLTRLPRGADAFSINAWHLTDRFVYDLCTSPRLLDYVEALIGPDILLWGSHFFCKEPGDGKTVGWHQDARYWPLAPHRSVTAWLAIDDSDVGNAAMRILPGTHGNGLLPHQQGGQPDSLLDLALDSDVVRGLALDDAQATAVELKAGEISLHDDNVIHGSPTNASQRRRCGLTMRFMPPEVRCDTSVWPHFSAIVVRGEDRVGANRLAQAPREGMESRAILEGHPY